MRVLAARPRPSYFCSSHSRDAKEKLILFVSCHYALTLASLSEGEGKIQLATILGGLMTLCDWCQKPDRKGGQRTSRLTLRCRMLARRVQIIMERIVFLERHTIQAEFRRPNFEHEWIEYPETLCHEVAERVRDATIIISNKLSLGEPQLTRASELKLIATRFPNTF